VARLLECDDLRGSNDICAKEAPAPVRRLGARGAESLSALSFKLAVLRHYRTVYRFSAAMLGDAAEGEDVTQDSFTALWTEKQRVENVKHWLLRVARNRCLDRLRKSGRFMTDEQPAGSDLGESRDPAWHYEHAELAECLKRHIDELPEPQRSLVVLFDLRGQSGASCADILGISENQVKVYLHRARRRLRMQLEKER
jgi:RNA polymerase sigma-70 factor (ECF subfamily)